MSIIDEIFSKTIEEDLNTSHDRLTSYFHESGAREIDLDRFHKSWVKTLQEARVFGRTTESLLPSDISLKLINELAQRYQTANQLVQRIQYLDESDILPSSSSSSTGSSSSVNWLKQYKELQIAEKNMKLSIKKLYEVRSHEVVQSSIPYEERMSNYRRKYRQIKLVWDPLNPKTSNLVEYFPLHQSFHDNPKLIHGIYTTKPLGDMDPLEADGQLGIIIDGYVTGVGVYSHCISALQSAWSIYQHLHDLCSLPNSSNIFPLPVTVQYSSEFQSDFPSIANSSLIYFIYEAPPNSSLLPFLALNGTSLAKSIRNYPLVLRRWCAQLGSAFRELKRSPHISLRPPSLGDVFIRQDGSLIIGNILLSERSLLARPSNSEKQQRETNNNYPEWTQFIEFLYSFLSNCLDLSRSISLTFSSETHSLNGIEISPSWLIETQNVAPFQSDPIVHLSISCHSTLTLALNNLPPLPQQESDLLYPLYTHFNTSHHYYHYHLKRVGSSASSTRSHERKVHIFHVKDTENQKLGTTARNPSDGGAIKLFDGDIILLISQSLPSNPDLLNITSVTTDSIPNIFLQGLIPGVSEIHVYIVCRNRSSLSHLSPDSQFDLYPQSLLNSLQPDQYLSPLIILSVKVIDYDLHLSSPPSVISSSLIVRELAAILELGMKSSEKEVLLCSQSLLTNMSDISPEDCNKQWELLRQRIFDENPSLGADFSRLSEQPPDKRQATIANLLAESERDEEDPPPPYGSTQSKTTKETKAWRLGYT